MARRDPIPESVKSEIAIGIAAGEGRNELARRHCVSPSVVTALARAHGLHFENDWRTVAATETRQKNAAARRAERLDELLEQYIALPVRQDARPTRRARRLSYAIYNTTRHHNGTYGPRIPPRRDTT